MILYPKNYAKQIFVIFKDNKNFHTFTTMKISNVSYNYNHKLGINRYYNPRISQFNATDPLAEKYPNFSPYTYTADNPVMLVDPDGMAMDEWNVDRNTGRITKISDKGGKTLDYYNVGVADDKKFYKDYQFAIPRNEKGQINYFRFKEDTKGTISAVHIPENNLTGFTLEPAGPDTIRSGQDKRIPEGEYNIIKSSDRPGMKNRKLKFPNYFVLYNKKVSMWRGITIHPGNYNYDTEGCLLPGTSFGFGNIGNLNKLKNLSLRQIDKIHNKVGYLRTYGSRAKLNEINNYINNKGYENVKIRIFNITE